LASFDRAAAILFALSEKTEIIVGDRPCRTSVLDGRGAVLHFRLRVVPSGAIVGRQALAEGVRLSRAGVVREFGGTHREDR
jgi:hypothetical protein